MEPRRYIIPLLIFCSPVLYCMAGCGRLDTSGEVRHVKTSDFLTPKIKPVSAPVETKPPATYDPLRVPTEDDPYAPPARVTLPPSNPPPVNTELLSNGEVCTDGSCAVQGGSEPRRGLFGRWRR